MKNSDVVFYLPHHDMSSLVVKFVSFEANFNNWMTVLFNKTHTVHSEACLAGQ